MVDSRWRTLQVFLSPKIGVYEVEINRANKNLRCSCPGWRARGECKHTRFVKNRIEANKGTYPLDLTQRKATKNFDLAEASEEEFRDFVLTYGHIEVL